MADEDRISALEDEVAALRVVVKHLVAAAVAPYGGPNPLARQHLRADEPERRSAEEAYAAHQAFEELLELVQGRTVDRSGESPTP